ncbi:MAG: hypothetical protein B1H04_00700 [Planctomycetales bacterium 4484_123]|nr:MAG: hypothetical protein B1H04_00700 [Planctomycetales bacterium 4484_123]
MANEHQTVRSVSWGEIFSFTHIFKSFRMAIHPSKILLALLAIVLVCVFGWVTERIWSAASDTNWVQKDEAWAYWTAESRAAFLKGKAKWLEDRVSRVAELIKPYGREITKNPARDLFGAIEALREQYRRDYQRALEEARKPELAAVRAAKDAKKLSDEQRRARVAQAREDRLKAEREALNRFVNNNRTLAEVRGQRIFDAFVKWQMRCVTNAVGAVARGNIFSGVFELYGQRGSMTPKAYTTGGPTNRTEFDASTNVQTRYGLVAWLMLMAWGLWWLVSAYPWYSLVLFLFCLAVWSVLGGAICRIAALHAALEEKISISAALKFGLSKGLSFFSAPLLPIAIAVFLGLLVALGGLVGAIPFVGEWFVAVLFGLALLAGVVMAFLLVGLAAGWPLMWPTIAVEGSDGFDAISRSFSYVFERPFQYGLYWLVAAVYGTVCYLFVRLFAFVVLAATHCWAGWAMKLAARPGYAEGAGKLDVMWAAPKFWSFHGPMQAEAMTRSEYWASWVLAGWVYLVAAVVLAFLVTFFLSAATNIYFLLRQKVDATDLDDVYVEEEAEEQVPPDQAEQAPVSAAPQPPAGQPESPPSDEGQPAETKPAPPADQKPETPAGEEPGEEQKGE